MFSAISSSWIDKAWRQGLGLLCLVGCAAGQSACAEALNPNQATNRPAAQDRDAVISISPFADVLPTDWAHQALQTLIERHGCVAGYPNGTHGGNRAMTRFEAAALLNACLDRITELTDDLKRLMKEFERELAILKGRVDGLDARVSQLEATQFSTTTKLSGQATFVLGANNFSGSASNLVKANKATFGATTLNYDLQLNFDTSFTGNDLLRTTLRSGNFDGVDNSFGGAGPSALSQLEVAFQEDAGPNIVGIDRFFYQLPMGDLTITLGGRVGQEDMLAIWPWAKRPSPPVSMAATLPMTATMCGKGGTRSR